MCKKRCVRGQNGLGCVTARLLAVFFCELIYHMVE